MEKKIVRILVIVVGGNISQITGDGDANLEPASVYQFNEFLFKSDRNNSLSLREGKISKQIFVDIERLIDVEDLEKQDSSQVNPIIWQELARKIKDNYDSYEGFVILHGLDTLAYTASAISFMLRNLDRPIVFTGSQRPLNFPRSDALQNIYTALTIAASKSLGLVPITEVTIYLHDTLYRANRASMVSASSYRSFDSLNYPPIATIGEHIDIKEDLIFRPSGNIVPSLNVDKQIQIIDVFPGMSPSLIEGIVDNIFLEKLKNIISQKLSENSEKYNKDSDSFKILKEIEDELSAKSDTNTVNTIKGGVILRTYGMGTLPTGVLKALRKLVKAKVIVMNVTQAHSSRVSFNSDLVSLRLFEHGVISGLDMTSEAAFAKMVVVLSNAKKGVEQCEDELQTNLAGEQSHTVNNFHFKLGETEKQIPNNDERKIIYNHSCMLKFENPNKDFILPLEDINNIQLRILGLKKMESGGGKVRFKIFRCDENSPKIANGIEIHQFEELLEDPPQHEDKTVNVSFDITHRKGELFGRDAAIYVNTDQKIEWSRISIVAYT